MITLKEISIKDFLSHELTRVQFSDGQRLLIEGKSGSGKSAILDAIVWCLYGKGRVDGRSLVRQGEKKAKVVLSVQDGEKEYEITRTVDTNGKNTLSVGVGAVDGDDLQAIPVSGLKNIQEWVEKDLIHASYQLFINSVAYPQDNADTFVKQTAAKRKELLMEMAPVADLDMYFERAKIQLQSTEEALQRLDGEFQSLQTSTESEDILQKAFTDTEASLEGKEVERFALQETLSNELAFIASLEQKAANLALLIKERDAGKGKVMRLTAEATAATEAVKVLGSIKKPEIDMAALTGQLQEIDPAISRFYEAQTKFKSKRYELDALQRNRPAEIPYEEEIAKINKQLIEAMKSVTSLCDLGENCKNHRSSMKMKTSFWEEQLVDRSQRLAEQNKLLSEYTEKVAALSKDMPEEPDAEMLQQLSVSRERIVKSMKESADYEDSRKQIEVAASALQVKLAELAGATEALEAADLKLSAAVTELGVPDLQKERDMATKITAELTTVREQSFALASLLGNLKQRIATVKYRNDRITELFAGKTALFTKKQQLEAVKEAFGSKGIKTLVIDILIPKLEEQINGILSRLSDFRVVLETARGNAAGDGQVEGLFINVVDPQGHQLEFASYSGGEKLKIIVAISEALASMQKVGFRLLDELFIGLDEASTEGFLSVLEKVQSQFSQVVCISHLREIKEAFSSKIEIKKLNGTSCLA